MRGIPGQALIGQFSIADPRNNKRRVGSRSAKYVPGKSTFTFMVVNPGTCHVPSKHFEQLKYWN